MTSQYHHGDLPHALCQAASEVISEKGLGGFSLREVARRAGVSHTAPAHHFGDMTGLLTALATNGFNALYDAQEALIDPDAPPAERLASVARAYVELAQEHPGYCEVMFRVDVVDASDPTLQEAGMRSYGTLVRTVEDLITQEGLSADVNDVTSLCWCAMQGLVVLRPKLELVDGLQGIDVVAMGDRIERFVAILLNGIRH